MANPRFRADAGAGRRSIGRRPSGWALVLGWTFALLLLFPRGEALACLWDRDTLASEITDDDVALRAIVGTFPRYPARYYAMRLERVTAELAGNPADPLSLLDDAAVACDRLGDPTAAIAWMERKQALLGGSTVAGYAPEALAEHQYRYLANLGTFYAHRALAMQLPTGPDMVRAEELIADAIELNPNAHFGREVVQLQLIRWMLAPPVEPDATEESRVSLWIPVQRWWRDRPATELVAGLAGIVVLGAAWESPFVFDALSVGSALEERGSVAHLARLRAEELVAAGRARPTWYDDLVGLPPGTSLERDRAAGVRAYFERARAEADRWHAEHVAFIEAQLAQGRHPDTHPGFWEGAPVPERVWVPGELSPRAFVGHYLNGTGILLLFWDYPGFLLLPIGFLVASVVLIRARRRARNGVT